MMPANLSLTNDESDSVTGPKEREREREREREKYGGRWGERLEG